MSTLGAMLLVVIVIGMLLAYYIGYAVGRREGFDQGRQAARTKRDQHGQQDQGQEGINRMDHLRNSSEITVAKNASAKEVSTNWGTLSMR